MIRGQPDIAIVSERTNPSGAKYGLVDWLIVGMYYNRSVHLSKVHLTQLHAYPTYLLAHRVVGEKKPRLLATNFPCLRQVLWVKETFGELKTHGFDIERTHLPDLENYLI